MIHSVIYQIQSKIKPERIYIGSTNRFSHRKNQHLNSLRNGTHKTAKIVRHCNKYGIDDLVFSVIEPCFPEFLIEREQYYLDLLQPFFNTRKIADSCLGVKCSDEKKEKLRIANKGHKISEEQKQQLRIANLGKKQSAETIRKKIKAHMGKKNIPETIEKMRIAATGRHHSEETKMKLRLINLGKTYVRSDETRKRLSESLKGNRNCVGHKITQEHIERLRESLIGNKHYLYRKSEQLKMKKLA